ncbi:MAG TPA: type I pullulanase [Kosmotogaceae bacterium]|nr:type I pullulanase [Kosmotogaceae bacterium]
MSLALIDSSREIRLLNSREPESILLNGRKIGFVAERKRRGSLLHVDEDLTPCDLVEYVEGGERLPAYPAGILDTEKYQYRGPLGFDFNEGLVDFRVWAPGHQLLFVEIYNTHDLRTPLSVERMEPRDNGVWSCRVTGKLKGKAYRYRIERGGVSKTTPDPYAPSAICNGNYSVIVDLADQEPEGWNQDHGPYINSVTDAIIYEMHVGDFSSSWTSDHFHKTKYISFCETDRKNTLCGYAGIDYIRKLGITHLHLLPFQDFSSVDELDPSYNWGYDPELHNVPEGSYSVNPLSGESRIFEVRQMVKALHDAGIGVIMDVVYNHTFRIDFPFHKLVPYYFHRLNERGGFSNGSGTGNELCTERFMVRRYVMDSLLHWLRNYHIDGFRFDLMALLGIPTLTEIETVLKRERKDVILYGEPWMAASSSMRDHPFVKGDQRGTSISVFNDDFRDAIKGRPDDSSKGFVSGKSGLERIICAGIAGSVDYSAGISGFTDEPTETINYCSSHDNLTLWDKLFKISSKDSFEKRRRMALLALSIVLTSQGVPFMHGGSEFLRTKLMERDSYKSSEVINEINYNRSSFYSESTGYVRELIRLRKREELFRLRKSADVRKKLSFVHAADNLVVFCLTDSTRSYTVMHNASPNGRHYGTDGLWNVLVHDTKADLNGLFEVNSNLAVEPFSTTIALRR